MATWQSTVTDSIKRLGLELLPRIYGGFSVCSKTATFGADGKLAVPECWRSLMTQIEAELDMSRIREVVVAQRIAHFDRKLKELKNPSKEDYEDLLEKKNADIKYAFETPYMSLRMHGPRSVLLRAAAVEELEIDLLRIQKQLEISRALTQGDQNCLKALDDMPTFENKATFSFLKDAVMGMRRELTQYAEEQRKALSGAIALETRLTVLDILSKVPQRLEALSHELARLVLETEALRMQQSQKIDTCLRIMRKQDALSPSLELDDRLGEVGALRKALALEPSAPLPAPASQRLDELWTLCQQQQQQPPPPKYSEGVSERGKRRKQ